MLFMNVTLNRNQYNIQQLHGKKFVVLFVPKNEYEQNISLLIVQVSEASDNLLIGDNESTSC